MFMVRCFNRAGELRYVDAEWDYRNDRLNWTRAFSFMPIGNMWTKIHADEYCVYIDYCW